MKIPTFFLYKRPNKSEQLLRKNKTGSCKDRAAFIIANLFETIND